MNWCKKRFMTTSDRKTNPPTRRVAVIGGGITGLAAAHRLLELAPNIDVTLFESSPRLGGALNTVSKEGFLLESGADNFITTVPWAVDLCKRIGFEDQLVPTNSGYRHAFVVRRGKLHHLPDGFVVMAPSKLWPILSTPILSPLGKLRMACEYLVPRRKQLDDESLAAFIRRRFGRETYERLVQPLVGGIYTGDPEKLSLRATMPRFAEMEQQYGSLIRAMYSQPKRNGSGSGARYSMFVAPREGMASMVEAIAKAIPADVVRLCSPVTRLEQIDDQWRLSLHEEREPLPLFDDVILASPVNPTARLVAAIDKEIATEIGAIHSARCSIVSLGYSRKQISHPLDGFGAVVPAIEGRKILSASFSSIKYPGRAPDNKVLIRIFMGGDCQPKVAGLPDASLIETACTELRQLLGISGEPMMSHVSCRLASMPQYFTGHQARVARIRDRLAMHRGLYVAGNAYDGVGVPNCIHSGEQAAELAIASLRDHSAACIH